MQQRADYLADQATQRSRDSAQADTWGPFAATRNACQAARGRAFRGSFPGSARAARFEVDGERDPATDDKSRTDRAGGVAPPGSSRSRRGVGREEHPGPDVRRPRPPGPDRGARLRQFLGAPSAVAPGTQPEDGRVGGPRRETRPALQAGRATSRTRRGGATTGDGRRCGAASVVGTGPTWRRKRRCIANQTWR